MEYAVSQTVSTDLMRSSLILCSPPVAHGRALGSVWSSAQGCSLPVGALNLSSGPSELPLGKSEEPLLFLNFQEVNPRNPIE